MTESLFQTIASTGIVGVFLVLALVALRAKDNALNAEKDSRIADAGKFNELAMTMQREVIGAVTELGKMLEIWERREAARETSHDRGYRRSPDGPKAG